MTREEFNYWLANIPRIGAVTIGELLHIYGSVEELYQADMNSLIQHTALKEKEIDALIASRSEDNIKRGYDKVISANIRFITKEDPDYPDRLKHIYGSPFALYVKGRLPEEGERTLAMIGARECSAYGKEVTKYLANAIASEGIGIISGLARGIDSCAHLGALSAGGKTYGILGCGIDICYPRENLELYMDMQQQGGVISEYAPGIKPLACNFPMRNRIISGLSDGILVIEAREKSGTLITVDMGLDQGKNIYALPGRITDSLSGGCNNLIKMGAKLVTSPQDIFEDFQMNSNWVDKQSTGNQPLLKAEEKLIYEALNFEPKYIEELAALTQLPLDRLMELLLSLEFRDLIKQTMKNYYIKRH